MAASELYKIKFKYPWGTKGFLLRTTRGAAKFEADRLLAGGADIEIWGRGPLQAFSCTRRETAAQWRARAAQWKPRQGA